MNSYEDNTIGLDDRNEYQKIIPMVRVEPNKSNNLDEIFTLIINKEGHKNDRTSVDKLTQSDLCKLDTFGTALARYVKCFFFSIELNFKRIANGI